MQRDGFAGDLRGAPVGFEERHALGTSIEVPLEQDSFSLGKAAFQILQTEVRALLAVQAFIPRMNTHASGFLLPFVSRAARACES